MLSRRWIYGPSSTSYRITLATTMSGSKLLSKLPKGVQRGIDTFSWTVRQGLLSVSEPWLKSTGLGPNKDQPPTDWESTFGGPAWSRSGKNDGQWYFHWFDSSQPDLNWNNEDVRADFIKTLRFWADRGVSGFRIDVAHACAKDMTGDLPDFAELNELTKKKLSNGYGDLVHPILDRDEVQDIYRSWRKVFNEYSPPLMRVSFCSAPSSS